MLSPPEGGGVVLVTFGDADSCGFILSLALTLELLMLFVGLVIFVDDELKLDTDVVVDTFASSPLF